MQKFCNPSAFLLFIYPYYNSTRTRIIILPVNFTLFSTNLFGAVAIIINYTIIIYAFLMVSISLKKSVNMRTDILYHYIN